MPDGWAASTGNFPLTELAPSPRYEKVVAAHGGYGELVDDPQQVLPALKRAPKIVKEERRQAGQCDLRLSLDGIFRLSSMSSSPV